MDAPDLAPASRSVVSLLPGYSNVFQLIPTYFICEWADGGPSRGHKSQSNALALRGCKTAAGAFFNFFQVFSYP